jgi:hypothetical protein
MLPVCVERLRRDVSRKHERLRRDVSRKHERLRRDVSRKHERLRRDVSRKHDSVLLRHAEGCCKDLHGIPQTEPLSLEATGMP